MPHYKTFKRTTGDFSLSSSWTLKQGENGKWKIKSGPTTSTGKKSFAFSVPSGSVISTARIWLKRSVPPTGVSSFTVNGSSKCISNAGAYGYDVKLANTAGTLNVSFCFKANGSTNNSQAKVSTIFVTDVYLEIVYEDGGSGGKNSKKSKGFKVPPQSLCIYDQNDGDIYMFDGVTKINHSLTMDLQEEVGGEKAKLYVNNAKNEPDKLTIDVLMSDVYTGGGAIISKVPALKTAQQTGIESTRGSLIQGEVKNPWTRSANAFMTLHWLKEQRKKLTVITPQYVHTDMIIASVTVNQDDMSPFGWEGQIAFQHAFPPKPAQKKAPKTNDDEDRPTPALGAEEKGKEKGGGLKIVSVEKLA